MTGEVRRVLAREGLEVTEGQPLVEIAVDSSAPSVVAPLDDSRPHPASNFEGLKTQIETARAEVVRREVEVQRLTNMVQTGQALQPDLDAARALYERAQQRLQSLKATAEQAQSRSVADQRRIRNPSVANPSPTQQLVLVLASGAGTIAAISARVGQRVIAGEPLATIRVSRP